MPKILGVRIDSVTVDQAVEKVKGWVQKEGPASRDEKHYIVTTNIEFIMASRHNAEFKKVLNESDLSISDSNRLDWAEKMSREKNPGKKLLLWPFFLAPNLLKRGLPVVPGVDLMDRLCQLSEQEGFTIGLLGGREGVAERTAECLKKKYPKLKISFASDGGKVDQGGNIFTPGPAPKIKCDILFVAFGQVKQEMWIIKNMRVVDSRVFMGVGGSFDYISGEVMRAPSLMRALGLEWLFRFMVQPWRIKRFGALLHFLFLIMVC